MSYQVLARKWRPRNFKELVGQIHVLQALVNALDHNRLHHAYLFTGTRGVGKTTIARILAKCLNCEEGVTSEPCGKCSSCCEIDEGRFVDLIEVDAASRTRLEDTKELLDNVQYAPTRGRFKVYLIDEVHMLSTHSFNALLKTLEEPPAHVKFLLATTDPHKLPITILSRCLQFSLKNMSPDKVVEHLQHVLTEEDVRFEMQALWQLGRAADGSMRDALSLTDQAIAYCGDGLTSQGVTAMLGTIDQAQVYRVLDALSAGNAHQVLQAVTELAEHGPDYVAVLADMLSTLHRVALAQVVPDVVDNSQGDREHVLELAGRITAEDLQLFYQTGLIGRRDLPLAPDPRSGFEMVLLRMLAFRPDGVSTAPTRSLPDQSQADAPVPVAAQDSAASAQEEHEEEPEPVAAQPAVTQPAAVQPIVQPVVEQDVVEQAPVGDQAPEPHDEVASSVAVSQPDSLLDHDSDNDPPPWPLETLPVTPAIEPAVEQHLPAVQSPPEKSNENSGASAIIANSVSDAPKIALTELTDKRWIALNEQLGVAGIAGTLLANCELVSVTDTDLTLRLDNDHDTFYSEANRQRIQGLLGKYFATDINLQIETGVIEGETPAAWRERKRKERQEAAIVSFTHDAHVQAIVSAFSGTICGDTIEPVG